MSLALCWWFALVAFFQCASAQATGTIHFFTSQSCSGSHLSCSNIPPNGCCSTNQEVFASAFLVTSQPDASVRVHSNPVCQGVSQRGDALACAQPSFAFSSAQWFTSSTAKARRNDSDASPVSENCRRPDLITLIDANGEEVKITVPEGENDEYESAFVHGDFAKLLRLAKINRQLRFRR